MNQTIVALLASKPDHPPKALYQHSFPYSRSWGYLTDNNARIIPFDEQEIDNLRAEGILKLTTDERGRQCVVLTESSAPAPSISQPAAEPTPGGGTVYRYADLMRLDGDTPVPPLVFIHIPRTAGSTLNKLLMRNYKFRADSYGNSFFPPYPLSQFRSLVEAPQSEDDRIRPAFFTGHIDLSNEIFFHMPVQYVAMTMLRDPVERIVSHYRFNSTQQSVFRDAIREKGLNVVDYYKHFACAIPQQYELFAVTPDTEMDRAVQFMDDEPVRVSRAVRNLERRVSLFGLQEDFSGFVAMLAARLGLPDVSYKPLNTLPPGATDVTTAQIKQLRKLLERDFEFYEAARAIYRQRALLMNAWPAAEHPWTSYYA